MANVVEKTIIMKTLFILTLILSFTAIEAPSTVDTSVLVGEWKLDMTPQNPDDSNFAMMRIEKVDDNTFAGTFYREGVAIRNGQINTQRGVVYGALVSGDNSGLYNTAFYYEDGRLYGSTHALDRGFLAVWIAEKM